ncbi:hypothetical protein N0V82_008063 [Gnomoniopsis sp. IMI 355080]|nr:hypothetical protein N0V82_008063 [Gnomoniopsis sp. IMI 355080]
MWTTHAAHGSRPQTRIPKSNSESTTAFGTPNTESSSRTHSVASQHQYTVSSLEAENFSDFLEPAVDGPPSPAMIRALNDKVKKASVSERHVSQHTSSSGAASSISYASSDRRPSWEQTLESFSLSRKSSIKSTTSSMPSKERPESVQAIGKAIFNRKNKFRRESLTTSTTSLTHSPEHTPDMTTDRSRAASSVSKDHILATMSIFSRRKTLHAGEDATAQRKPTISSPFNFQHVAQIQRDQLPTLARGDHGALQSEMSGLRTPPALGENLRVPNFSSGTSRPRDEEESVPPDMVVHSREDSATRAPNIHKAHPRQWVKQTKSQDQIRGFRPPRPPRSPTELNVGGYFDYAPPAVPARNASRPSIPRRDSEALGNMISGRQRSTSNVRFPALHLQADADLPASPASSPGEPSPFVQERRFSRIYLPADNPNWPLSAPLNNNSVTTFEAALPEVPEEEEQSGLPPRSRQSNKSTNSSLRGSFSVPALRKASLSDASYASHDRTYSRDSVVLGAFDISASRQISEADIANRAQALDPLRRDSWEAVIDYCYEHEMEADCDYDWHRPSVELDSEPTVLVTESEDQDTGLSRPPSDCIELPILSPPSHDLSPQSSQEVFTPRLTSGTKSPTNANFSLPRRERPQRLLHVRNESQISFTEAQGFSLSPSFLIPTDYHHELLAAQTQKYQDPESVGQSATLEEPNADLFQSARASASTLASNGNLSTRSVFERHISSTSTNTDYTRLTMSISSVDMEGFNFKDDVVPVPTTCEEQQEPELPSISPTTHTRSRSAAGLLGTATSTSPGLNTPGLSRDTHCSDPNLGGLQSPKQNVAGRARSRTLSSTPGNFSLFPSVTKAPPRS